MLFCVMLLLCYAMQMVGDSSVLVIGQVGFHSADFCARFDSCMEFLNKIFCIVLESDGKLHVVFR